MCRYISSKSLWDMYITNHILSIGAHHFMYFYLALLVIVQVALEIFPESVHGSGHRDGHGGVRSIENALGSQTIA